MMLSDQLTFGMRHLLTVRPETLLGLISIILMSGCYSPYRADRGALFGGLTGAGVGAAIGNASGNTATGAILGSAVGAMTGAVVGGEMDAMQAENQAMIEQRLGRPMAAATTQQDVIAMSQAGLGDEVIIQHLQTHGMAQLPSAADLIRLKSQGVSDGVLRAMQQPASAPVAVAPAPSTVYVQERYYAPPCWPPYPHHVHVHRHSGWHATAHRPGVSWGVAVHH